MLTRIRIVTACLLFPFVLSSCGLFEALVIGRLLDDCHPQGVSFSKVALSGVFEGWVDDYPTKGEKTPLRFELEPSYIDENEYSVSGTFQLAEETPLSLQGQVTGGCTYNYRPQAEVEPQRQAPPAQGLLAAAEHRGEAVWLLAAGGKFGDAWLDTDFFRGELLQDSDGERYLFSANKLF